MPFEHLERHRALEADNPIRKYRPLNRDCWFDFAEARHQWLLPSVCREERLQADIIIT